MKKAFRQISLVGEATRNHARRARGDGRLLSQIKPSKWMDGGGRVCSWRCMQMIGVRQKGTTSTVLRFQWAASAPYASFREGSRPRCRDEGSACSGALMREARY